MAMDHHRRRQGLPQGGLHPHRPVPPLVEPGAGGVQVQCALVPEEGELELVEGAVLREALQSIGPAQAVRRRLFDGLLTVGHGVELTVQGVALHREAAVLRDEVLPGHGGGELEEGLEAPGGTGGKLDEHPLAAPQADVQPGDVRLRAGAEDPSGLGPHVPEAQAAHLVRHQALQAEETGDGECHVCFLRFDGFRRGFGRARSRRGG